MSQTIAAENRHNSSPFDIRALWKQKWTIGLFAILGFVSCNAYLWLTTPTFEIQSRLVVREENPSFETNDRTRLPDREFLATQAEVIRSPLIVRQALNQAPITVPESYTRGDVAFVLESLSVTPVLQTDIVKISYRGQDVMQIKAFVTALAEQYLKHIRQVDRGRNSDEVQSLLLRESELVTQLGQLQKAYSDFRRSTPLIGQGREGLALQSHELDHLAQRLSEARSRRIELEDKVRDHTAVAVSESKDTEGAHILTVARRPIIESPAVIATPMRDDGTANQVLRDASRAADTDLAEVQKQVWLAQMTVKNMAETLGPQHPEFLSAQDRATYWAELLVLRTHAASAGLVQELKAAKASEAQLQSLFESERERIKSLDNYLVEDAILTGKIQRTELALDTVGKRLKEHELTEEQLRRGRSSIDVTVLDGSEVQEQVIWPQPKSLLGLCGMLGLVAGVLVASLRERSAQQIHS